MKHNTRGTIGILEANSSGPVPFTEAAFCRQLCIAGKRNYVSVYVFCPGSVTPGHPEITGFTYERGRWIRKLFMPPDIVYDRWFSNDRRQLLLKQQCLQNLQKIHPFVHLTRGLTGKWAVYQVLKQYNRFKRHLPATVKYEGLDQLDRWLQSHQGKAFLKPQSGSHGKRTLFVQSLHRDSSAEFLLTGRDAANRLFRRKFDHRYEALQWIDQFIGERAYVLQHYLNLTSSGGEPFDVRVLVQKNEHGEWTITGMAIRAGRKNSLTSNLHGGGTAFKVIPFLSREFGETSAKRIIECIQMLSKTIPVHLETHFGRLGELGIDFGVDDTGNVWILEVNSKPGRSSLYLIGDKKGAKKAIENPIQYAKYLLLHRV